MQNKPIINNFADLRNHILNTYPLDTRWEFVEDSLETVSVRLKTTPFINTFITADDYKNNKIDPLHQLEIVELLMNESCLNQKIGDPQWWDDAANHGDES